MKQVKEQGKGCKEGIAKSEGRKGDGVERNHSLWFEVNQRVNQRNYVTTGGKRVEDLSKCPGLGLQAETPSSASFSAEELKDSVSNAPVSFAHMQERIRIGKSRSPSSPFSL